MHEGVEIAAQWTTWDGEHHETASFRFENGAWTVDNISSRHRAHVVLRLHPDHQVRQFLLFRDLEEPDLWLGNDGKGNWGEINGDHREELEGSEAIDLEFTPLTNSIVIRGLLGDDFEVGESYEATIAKVDVETLGVVQEGHTYERLGEFTWRITTPSGTFEAQVDDDGLILDIDGRFRRREQLTSSG